MSEPAVTYTIREMFDRIERRLDHLEKQVAALDATAASVATVRRALLAAATSPLVAVGLAWWIARK